MYFDIYERIFDYLDYSSLLDIRLVCKQWKDFVEKSTHNSIAMFNNNNLTTLQILEIIKTFNLKNIILDFGTSKNYRIESVLKDILPNINITKFTPVVDHLTIDPSIFNQNYVCLSFVNGTDSRAIKVRGVYETYEEAVERARHLNEIDDRYNIYVGEVGKWLPLEYPGYDINNWVIE